MIQELPEEVLDLLYALRQEGAGYDVDRDGDAVLVRVWAAPTPLALLVAQQVCSQKEDIRINWHYEDACGYRARTTMTGEDHGWRRGGDGGFR